MRNRELHVKLRTFAEAGTFGPNTATLPFYHHFGDIETEAGADDIDLVGTLGASKFLEKFWHHGRINANTGIRDRKSHLLRRFI